MSKPQAPTWNIDEEGNVKNPRPVNVKPITVERVRPKLWCMADVKFKEMKWLWNPYIPAGNVTLIFGDGGIGKSFISCAIAAEVSRGGRLPGQCVNMRPQKVLMLSAEDDLEVVLQPRLELAGANMENIFIPSDPFILDARGIKDVQWYMQSCAATVVFIDPMVSYMGGDVDLFKANQVRSVMGPLQVAANQSGCAIIVVHHTRKDSGGRAQHRASGSADFVNAARSTVLVDVSNDGTKVFRHVKSNYAKLGPVLAFSLSDAGAFTWDGTYDGPLEGEDGGGKPKTAGNIAIAFLKATLAAGPVPSAEVTASAEDEGIALATLNRVKPKVAKSIMRRVKGTLTWFWALEDWEEAAEGDEEPTDENTVPSVEAQRDDQVPLGGDGVPDTGPGDVTVPDGPPEAVVEESGTLAAYRAPAVEDALAAILASKRVN